MGRINQGILGGFRNKVGTVVGYFRYGEAIMRGLAGQVSNPRTPLQEAARARFSLITKAVNANLGFINAFYKQVGTRTRQNSAVSRNLNNGCIQGTGTSVTIDFSKFEVSQGGEGVNVQAPAVTQGTGHTLVFSWTDNTGVTPETLSSDIVAVLVYNPARQQAVYDISNASRLDSSAIIAYPALWAGEAVECYIATRSDNFELLSPSDYLSSVVVN